MTFNPQPKTPFVAAQYYLDWVKTLLCLGCKAPADDPHHIIGYGFAGMAMTADDFLSMPLCRGCHTELHNDPKAWEIKRQSQLACVIYTLRLAFYVVKIITGSIYQNYIKQCYKAWDVYT